MLAKIAVGPLTDQKPISRYEAGPRLPAEEQLRKLLLMTSISIEKMNRLM